MSNKKQTPVEFLEESLSIHFTQEQQMQFIGLFIQAQQLHKQQIIDAYSEGGWNEYTIAKTAEQYYKDNYETDN